jgi:ribosomal protein L28
MKTCEICGKGYIVKTVRKKLRGKYNPTTKQRKYPNLQWVKLPAGVKSPDGKLLAQGKKVKACTKCIRTLSKTR